MPQPAQPDVIYIIDDDPHFCAICAGQLRERDIKSHSFTTLTDALASPGPAPSAIILDWQLGMIDSLTELPRIKSRFQFAPIILTTAAPAVTLVVRAIKAGAFDFLPKPLLDEARLYATVPKAVVHGRLLARAERIAGRYETTELQGQSEAVLAVLDTIRMAAPTDATLLILGESGTGKELAARAAHDWSRRKGELVCVNMAALPRELVESTLFGHERGSFTGAEKQRKGLCEQAADGTLFFDEIGEMPIDLQAKLLRFLQERTFRRVGGSEEVRSDARIIAATNRDLLEDVRDGRFREDLFYRLSTIPIELPPLRQRGHDIIVLAFAFLREFAQKYGREFESISPEASTQLGAYGWPGNVRELRQVIERVVVLNDARELEVTMLPETMRQRTPMTAAPTARADTVTVLGEAIVTLEEMETRMIQRAMEQTNGSARDAAKILGISLATLYRRIK